MLKTVSSITNAIGALNYKGIWNASTNSPALASGVGTKGDYYVVSVAGTTTLDGINIWGVGDWVVFNGSVWQRVDGGSDGEFVNMTAGNIKVSGNKVESINTNGDIQLDPNGTGKILLTSLASRRQIGGKVEIDFSVPAGTTRTITISCNIANVTFMDISAAAWLAAGTGHGRAKFIVGGDTRATSTYGTTQLALTNAGSATISGLTAGNGSITFTIANAGAQSGQGIVSIDYSNAGGLEVTMSVV